MYAETKNYIYIFGKYYKLNIVKELVLIDFQITLLQKTIFQFLKKMKYSNINI